MATNSENSTCVLLTATIQVSQNMIFTERREPRARLADYKMALRQWLALPHVKSLVLVENSGSDLSELRDIAERSVGKSIEFLSFTAPEFDGALGKGFGEMICLQHALEHSRLLRQSSKIVKVTGRYSLANAGQFLDFVRARADAEVICDMLRNLTWADSRAFASTSRFLSTYLFPLKGEINDSQASNFEHVLARAVHACMADRGTWAEPPFPLQVQGISGSQGRGWKMSLLDSGKLRVRHKLFARFLATGPR